MARIRSLTPTALRTRWALAALRVAAHDGDGQRPEARGVEAMGLVFPGRVGLAAGFDRRGTLRATAHRLGLGAIELGSFAGPRASLAGGVPRRVGAAVVGISLGKHPATPWSRAEADLAAAMRALYREADYFTVNPGRDLPPGDHFVRVVAALAGVRNTLAGRAGRPLPLVAKLPAAWLADVQRASLCTALVAAGASGLLLSAEGMAPRQAHAVLGEVAAAVGRETCLISVGGIDGVREARRRIAAGARLVQLHRAVAREGEPLIRRLNRTL